MVSRKFAPALNTDSEPFPGQRLARECFLQEAMASWAAFKENGLHLTGEEVLAWLRTWGTDNEQPAPECHE